MSTLIEELTDAADLAEAAGRKTGTLGSITEGNLFAARLRKRVQHVKELRAYAEGRLGEMEHRLAKNVIDALTGDL